MHAEFYRAVDASSSLGLRDKKQFITILQKLCQ